MPTVNVTTGCIGSRWAWDAIGDRTEALFGSTQSLLLLFGHWELSPQPFGCPSVTMTSAHFLPGFAASYSEQYFVPPMSAPAVGVLPCGLVPSSELSTALALSGRAFIGTAGV